MYGTALRRLKTGIPDAQGQRGMGIRATHNDEEVWKPIRNRNLGRSRAAGGGGKLLVKLNRCSGAQQAESFELLDLGAPRSNPASTEASTTSQPPPPFFFSFSF